MMVIPVSQHKLIKIRKVNRKKLTTAALYCSLLAVTMHAVGTFTNSWLYTSEVLKYYVFPNATTANEDGTQSTNQTTYFKNATIGPWVFCYLDPITEFHCQPVSYMTDEDSGDVTTSVQQSSRRSYYFAMSGMILDVLGVLNSFLCHTLPNPYASLFVATLIHINAGLLNFLSVIVFMSAVSKEVGNKIYPASEMDDPLFDFDFGYSFILVQIAFLFTEMAALLSIVVYMAKRDERTFNRYKLRSLLTEHSRALLGRKVTTATAHPPNNVRNEVRNMSNSSFRSARPSLDSMRCAMSPVKQQRKPSVAILPPVEERNGDAPTFRDVILLRRKKSKKTEMMVSLSRQTSKLRETRLDGPALIPIMAPPPQPRRVAPIPKERSLFTRATILKDGDLEIII